MSIVDSPQAAGLYALSNAASVFLDPRRIIIETGRTALPGSSNLTSFDTFIYLKYTEFFHVGVRKHILLYKGMKVFLTETNLSNKKFNNSHIS